MPKPRLCKKCKDGEHCTVSTCVKAANAYDAGYAKALSDLRAIAEKHEVSAAELQFDRFAGAVNGEYAQRIALVLVKILDVAESGHA